MNIASAIRHFLIDYDPECVKYDHEPQPPLKRGPDAIRQARYSAIALEQDREQLRADLMRQRRENLEQRNRIENALDNLDALRVLETAT